MKEKTLCVTISLILLSTSFAFVPIGKTRTDSENVLSAWASKVPTIDGVISPGEWDDAAKVIVALVSQSNESHSATIYEKNDALYMYLAARVFGDDFNAQDGVFFQFDNDHDGKAEQGDDWLYVLAWTSGLGYAEDGYYNAGLRTLMSDVADQGTNDIVGGASHTNVGGIGDYTFELRHPLDSADDAHDFSLRPGDTVGFKMEYDDAFPGGAYSSPWPGFGQFAGVTVDRSIDDQSIDWWPMRNHDVSRTGCSTTLAPNTNKTIWRYAAGRSISQDPVVVDGTVLIGIGEQVFAFDAAKGTIKWTFDADKSVSSTTVANGRVFFAASAGMRDTPSESGVLCALNETTVELLWNFSMNRWVGDPVVYENKIFVAFRDGNLYALDENTGIQVWNTTGSSDRSIDQITIHGDRVFATAFNMLAKPWTYELYCLNATTGAYIWGTPFDDFIGAQPMVSEGKVFIGCEGFGGIFALDEQTGKRLWSYPGWTSTTPAFSNGKVIVASRSGVPKLLALNATTGNLIWSYDVNDDISSPAVADGKVFVVESYREINQSVEEIGEIFALDEATGTKLWNYETGGMIISSPAVADGKLFIGSYDGYLYAFGSLTSDVNQDGIVDIFDITIVAVAFNSKVGDPTWNQAADLDKNGVIDIVDITMVAVDFGR